MPSCNLHSFRRQRQFPSLAELSRHGVNSASVKATLPCKLSRLFNMLNEQIAEMLGRGQASGKSLEFAELTRRLGFECNGMILHEYYFSNLRAASEPQPPSGSGITRRVLRVRRALGGRLPRDRRTAPWQTPHRVLRIASVGKDRLLVNEMP